jgi:hypothetical protein
VVSYSRYLSKRDEESFLSTFNTLKVNNLIRYGTFHDLALKVFQSKCDTVELTKSLLSNKLLSHLQQQQQQKRFGADSN